MKKDTIVIGTRSSKLALWQADYVEAKLREKYPELHVVQKRMTTKGDRVLDAPLAKIGGKGLFTKELEQAMLAGEIDLAVHSLKDMPTELPEGLMLAAVTERFLSALAGVTEPEAKRKIIGREFIRSFEAAQRRIIEAVGAEGGEIRFLVQGTLYP
ncbi:MAG: hypothetical protein ACFNY0_07575, partial [Selenomonas sp.]